MSRKRKKSSGNNGTAKNTAATNGGGKGAQPGGRSGQGSSKKKRRKKGPNPAKFWGDAAALPEPISNVTMTSEPTAVVQSIGRPPIPGQENVASHYFQAVYGGAVQLAGALAAAGELLESQNPDADEASDG